MNRLATLLLLVLVACTTEKSNHDLFQSGLFQAVQSSNVFPDSKTFPDCTPKRSVRDILSDYEEKSTQEDFDLVAFVYENFELPNRPSTRFETDSTQPIEAHIRALWPVLTRAADQPVSMGSLIPLPKPYVVPGGRFSEIYYWDSYFTMLGLQAEGNDQLIESMVDNFAFLIDSLGHIPNGNRTYYLSRSQPPFFSLMVSLLAEKDPVYLQKYLPQLLREHDFWMKGRERVTAPGQAYERVVMMGDGTYLNRYWDNSPTPRPEAFKEDVAEQQKSGRTTDDIYRNLRAGAESGWDFSSRWFKDAQTLHTIRTTEIIPVDLNALMFHLENTIARAYREAKDSDNERPYRTAASNRRRALLTFMWDPQQNFFVDFDWQAQKPTGIKTLAGMFPFFIGFPQRDLAEKAASVLESDFLKPGGLTTTLVQTGQQWDAPNGWAPLQWVSYKALRNYGHDHLAQRIRARWLRQNERVYQRTGKLMEKYNVMDTTLLAGGGEYPNQDGFGWTNGVYLAMKADTIR